MVEMKLVFAKVCVGVIQTCNGVLCVYVWVGEREKGNVLVFWCRADCEANDGRQQFELCE